MANKIIKGQTADLIISILDKSCPDDPQPAPFAGVTGCTAYFAKDDGTALAATGSVFSADRAQFKVSLLEADTDLIAAGDPVDFEVHYYQSTNFNIIQFLQKLTVTEQLF